MKTTLTVVEIRAWPKDAEDPFEAERGAARFTVELDPGLGPNPDRYVVQRVGDIAGHVAVVPLSNGFESMSFNHLSPAMIFAGHEAELIVRGTAQ